MAGLTKDSLRDIKEELKQKQSNSEHKKDKPLRSDNNKPQAYDPLSEGLYDHFKPK